MGTGLRLSALLLIVAALIAAACSGDPEEPETPTAETSTPTAIATSTPTPTATPTPTPTAQPVPASLLPYTSDAHGVTLLAPEGWVTYKGNPDSLTVSNPTGIADIEVRFSTFLAEPTPAQFDEFVSLRILSLQAEVPGFEEVSRERLTDPPGFIIAYTSDETGTVVLYTYSGARGVEAVATTERVFFSNFRSLFEQVLKSVSVAATPPAPTPTPGPTASPTPTPIPTPLSTIAPGRYTNDQFGFTLEVPLGWGLLAPAKEDEVRFIGPERVIVQVLTGRIAAGMSNADFSQALIESRYEPLAGFNIESEDDVTHGNLAGRELRFTADSGLDGATQKHLVLVTKRGIRAYVIEAIGPESAFEDYEAEIEALVSSFRLR